MRGLMDKTGGEYRHDCEVRWIVNLVDVNKMKDYMDKVQIRRGANAADKLRDDVRAEIKRQRDERKSTDKSRKTIS